MLVEWTGYLVSQKTQWHKVRKKLSGRLIFSVETIAICNILTFKIFYQNLLPTKKREISGLAMCRIQCQEANYCEFLDNYMYTVYYNHNSDDNICFEVLDAVSSLQFRIGINFIIS